MTSSGNPMICKPRDRAWRQLAEQELELLLGCALTPRHRDLVRNELYRFRSGNKGEQDTAYYLDVRFRDTPNWIVLHDLRLTDGSNVVQIDHLLINRVMEFFVLETKRFQGKTLRITEEGEFLLEENEQVRSLPSPIAQNDRHITILKRILQAQQILPKKLFSPVFYNYVLIHPDTRIERPDPQRFSTQNLCKSDLFYQEIDRLLQLNAFTNFFRNVARLHSVVGKDTLQNLGQAILQFHQPGRPDYKKQFGITPEEISSAAPTTKPSPAAQETEGFFCFHCKEPISPEEARFCFRRKERFQGRPYCRKHQQEFSVRHEQVSQKG